MFKFRTLNVPIITSMTVDVICGISELVFNLVCSPTARAGLGNTLPFGICLMDKTFSDISQLSEPNGIYQLDLCLNDFPSPQNLYKNITEGVDNNKNTGCKTIFSRSPTRSVNRSC